MIILGKAEEKLLEKQGQFLNAYFESFYLPVALAASDYASKTEALAQEQLHPVEEDYQGTWEDAFLANGYENGKYSFLTHYVILSIRRHGFSVKFNRDPEFHSSKATQNAFITQLWYNGQNCFPTKDRKGDPVVVGVTDPRLYLPDIVIKLLDLEFGYDKDLLDAI
jgi:hypothetical protein